MEVTICANKPCFAIQYKYISELFLLFFFLEIIRLMNGVQACYYIFFIGTRFENMLYLPMPIICISYQLYKTPYLRSHIFFFIDPTDQLHAKRQKRLCMHCICFYFMQYINYINY